MTTRRLREVAGWLRTDFPLPTPVRVRKGGDKYYKGHTTRGASGVFYITVCDIETLLHEWAHALTWGEWETGALHGPIWGAKHSEIIRWFHEEGEFAKRD